MASMSTVVPGLAGVAGIGLIAFGLALQGGITDTRWLALLGLAWLLLLVASRMRLSRALRPFNRALIGTALVIATVFLVISAQLIRIQLLQSDET